MKSISFNLVHRKNKVTGTERPEGTAKPSSGKKAKSVKKNEGWIASLSDNPIQQRREAVRRYFEYKKQTSLGLRVGTAILEGVSLLFLVVLLLAFALVYFNNDIRSCQSNMEYTYETIHQRSDYTAGILEKYDENNNQQLIQETEMMKLCLLNTPKEQWAEKLNVMKADESDTEFYLTYGDKVVYKSLNAGPIDVDEEDMKDLEKGNLVCKTVDGVREAVYSIPFKSYYLTAVYRDLKPMNLTDVRGTFGLTQAVLDGGIIVYNPETYVIYETNQSDDYVNREAEVQKFASGNFERKEFREYYGLAEIFEDLNSYQILEKPLNENTSVLIYHSFNSCLKTSLYDVIVQIFFFFILAVIVIFNIRVVLTVRSRVRGEKEVFHLFGRLYFDKTMAKRLLSELLIAEIALILMSLYLAYLNEMSYENIRASMNLKHINIEKQTDIKDSEELETVQNRELAELLNKATLLIESDSVFQETDNLKKIAEIVDASEITLFDAKGLSTASSGDYTGYKLGTDEATGEKDPMLYLLESSSNDKLVLLDSQTGRSYYGMKRRETAGIIRYEVKNNYYADLLKGLNGDSALLEADFGNDDIIYYDASKPDELRLARAGAHEVEVINNELSESMLHDGYFGRCAINGTQYYLNVASDTNVTGNYFIQAQKQQTLAEAVSLIVVGIFKVSWKLFAFLWITGSLCFTTAGRLVREVKEDETDEMQEQSEKAEQGEAEKYNFARNKLLEQNREILQKNFIRTVSDLIISCVAAFVLFFLTDLAQIETSTSMISYLYSFKWDKGLNIFSFTMILFYTLLILVFAGILAKLIRGICENMGPAGITVGSLLISLLKFFNLLAILLITLTMLGVNTGTILASAGLTSVVIGIGAQSTVNDILAGFFVIFEGNFRVGEIISIDGWIGVIKEIGVRTTTIESYGFMDNYKNLRVINNSSMKNVINLSRNPSMATAYIPIPYETDMDFVEEIFEANAELLGSLLPNATDGPFYDGLQRLDDSAKVIRFRVRCDEADRIGYSYAMLQYCTTMLEQNGIDIPFNQVVIHEASEEKSGENEVKIQTTTGERS